MKHNTQFILLLPSWVYTNLKGKILIRFFKKYGKRLQCFHAHAIFTVYFSVTFSVFTSHTVYFLHFFSYCVLSYLCILYCTAQGCHRRLKGDYLWLFSAQGDYGDFFNEKWLKKQLFLHKGDYRATFFFFFFSFSSHGLLIWKIRESLSEKIFPLKYCEKTCWPVA